MSFAALLLTGVINGASKSQIVGGISIVESDDGGTTHATTLEVTILNHYAVPVPTLSHTSASLVLKQTVAPTILASVINAPPTLIGKRVSYTLTKRS